MGRDHRRARTSYRIAEDFAWMDEGSVQGADRNRLHRRQSMTRIQMQGQKTLAVAGPEFLHEQGHEIRRSRNGTSGGYGATPASRADLEGGRQPPGRGASHPLFAGQDRLRDLGQPSQGAVLRNQGRCGDQRSVSTAGQKQRDQFGLIQACSPRELARHRTSSRAESRRSRISFDLNTLPQRGRRGQSNRRIWGRQPFSSPFSLVCRRFGPYSGLDPTRRTM